MQRGRESARARTIKAECTRPRKRDRGSPEPSRDAQQDVLDLSAESSTPTKSPGQASQRWRPWTMELSRWAALPASSMASMMASSDALETTLT